MQAVRSVLSQSSIQFSKLSKRGAGKFLGALGLLAIGLLGVSTPSSQAAHPAAAIQKHSSQAQESMPPALRKAWIAARQSEAGKEYAWQQNAGQRQAQIKHPQGFLAAAQADQLKFGAPGQAVGMHLAAVQCAGEKRQALDESRPAPKIKSRRAEYALKGGVTEWYENGPMGLEQGFTLTKPCKNPGELTLEIALTGAKSIEPTGTEADPKIQITPKDPSQKPYNYSNLYAEDALGKALKAKMSVKEEKILLTVIATEAKYPIVVDPLVWVETQKVVAGDGEKNNSFGSSVALSGDTAVIGAPFAGLAASGSTAGTDRTEAGAAYVFVKNGNVWNQQTKLVAGDGRIGDYFGCSVALYGDTAVIGACEASLAATGSDAGTARRNAGAVYVFVRSGNAWTQQTKLVAKDGQAVDNFGGLVALSGDTAVIGVPWADLAITGSDAGIARGNAGAAYVFVRSGNAWTQQTKLVAEDGRMGDYFGNSVALSGDTTVIGAGGADLAATGSDAGTARWEVGAVYVFVRSGNVWNQQTKLVARDGKTIDWFGCSVALSGDTAMIGAYQASLAATGSDAGTDRWKAGAVYVFVRSGNAWTQQTKLVARDGKTVDNFGNSVALSGDTAVIGAYQASLAATGSDAGIDRGKAGAAYVFVKSGNVWTQQTKLVAEDEKKDDLFGISVALSEDMVLIGAYRADLSADKTDAGALYSFHSGKSSGESCEQARDCAVLFCGQTFKKCGLPGAASCHSNAQCRDNLCQNGFCISSCSSNDECTGGFCVDGMCCDSACGGGSDRDCLACSVALGGAQDGLCGPILRENNFLCLAAGADQLCDAGAFCDGIRGECPSQHRMKPLGTVCRASQGEGDFAELCDGLQGTCPADQGPAQNPPPAPPPNPLSDDSGAVKPAQSGCHCDVSGGSEGALFSGMIPPLVLSLFFVRRRWPLRRFIQRRFTSLHWMQKGLWALLWMGMGCTSQNSPVPPPTGPITPQADNTLPIELTSTGRGFGRVFWLQGGKECFGDSLQCTLKVTPGQEMTLVAMPDENSVFRGFSEPGCAAGQVRCTLTPTEKISFEAPFDAEPVVQVSKFTLVREGFEGTVTSNLGHVCFANGERSCSINVIKDSNLKLTATSAAKGFADGFEGGACPLEGDACSVQTQSSDKIRVFFVPGVKMPFKAAEIGMTRDFKESFNRQIAERLADRIKINGNQALTHTQIRNIENMALNEFEKGVANAAIPTNSSLFSKGFTEVENALFSVRLSTFLWVLPGMTTTSRAITPEDIGKGVQNGALIPSDAPGAYDFIAQRFGQRNDYTASHRLALAMLAKRMAQTSWKIAGIEAKVQSLFEGAVLGVPSLDAIPDLFPQATHGLLSKESLARLKERLMLDGVIPADATWLMSANQGPKSETDAIATTVTRGKKVPVVDDALLKSPAVQFLQQVAAARSSFTFNTGGLLYMPERSTFLIFQLDIPADSALLGGLEKLLNALQQKADGDSNAKFKAPGQVTVRFVIDHLTQKAAIDFSLMSTSKGPMFFVLKNSADTGIEFYDASAIANAKP